MSRGGDFSVMPLEPGILALPSLAQEVSTEAAKGTGIALANECAKEAGKEAAKSTGSVFASEIAKETGKEAVKGTGLFLASKCRVPIHAVFKHCALRWCSQRLQC